MQNMRAMRTVAGIPRITKARGLGLGNTRTSFRFKSSMTAAVPPTFVNSQAPSQQSPPQPSKSVIDFTDYRAAFKSKSTPELIRSIIVFKMCSIQWFVQNARQMLDMSEKYLGKTITMGVVRNTFFRHFCAGEDSQEIKTVVNKLTNLGVGSILDFAAEADVQKTPQETGAICRTYDEEIEEAECDKNVDIFLECIKAAAQFNDGFAAIKLTGLGRPVLLERISVILEEIRKLFVTFDKDGSRTIEFHEFSSGITQLGVDMDEKAKRELFDKFDHNNNGSIDMIAWTEYLRVENLKTRPFFTERQPTKGTSVLPSLDEKELKQFDRMIKRLNKIAEAAAASKVRLLVDAEQTYFQPAISHYVFNLQRKYNKEFPVVFNTYQAYLKESKDAIATDLERAKRENFIFAAKLVRGAYMVAERRRAETMNYSDPIWPSIDDTHRNYHECMGLILDNINRSNVMVASHNQKTIEHACNEMARRGIPKSTGGVFFGQLLGMSDHLSLILGQNGYKAYKYVPYGPVQYVVPYLLRRAEENSNILGGTAYERKLLWKEFTQRINIFAK